MTPRPANSSCRMFASLAYAPANWLQGLEAVSALGGMQTGALGRGVIDEHEHAGRSLAPGHRGRHVGASRRVRYLGGGRAVVRLRACASPRGAGPGGGARASIGVPCGGWVTARSTVVLVFVGGAGLEKSPRHGQYVVWIDSLLTTLPRPSLQPTGSELLNNVVYDCSVETLEIKEHKHRLHHLHNIIG